MWIQLVRHDAGNGGKESELGKRKSRTYRALDEIVGFEQISRVFKEILYSSKIAMLGEIASFE